MDGAFQSVFKRVQDFAGGVLASKSWERRIDAIEKSGDLYAAIDELQRVARTSEDGEVFRRLLTLRFKAARAYDRPAPSEPVTPSDAPPPFKPIPKDALSPARLRQGLSEHGCLWVKHFFGKSDVSALTELIDKAFNAKRADFDGRENWFDLQTPHTFIPKDHWGTHIHKMKDSEERLMLYASPEGLSKWIDIITHAGLTAFVENVVGERPYITASKTMLRRVNPIKDHVFGWHQDGAFMGRALNTVNVWAPLNDCGENSPGLAILPRRIDLLPTGTEGAMYDWSVSHTLIEAQYGKQIETPLFEAGDLLLFDGFFLHRSLMGEHMTHPRYAVESWFFSSKGYPKDYTPLVV
ncbi:MAG: phytanoyl-CoA dioxygenase family protein [Pseudomonadota bacterium]